MQNTVIYLIGFPGTGKYTIAKEICSQSPDFRLVDNHLINNPIFSIIHQGGKTKLPQKVWEKVDIIWDVVFDTMKTLSPKEYNFILTNVLFENNPGDHEQFQNVYEVAKARGSCFVPVVLTCSLEELQIRVRRQDRSIRMKMTDADKLREYFESRPILNINHPNLLTLDVTELSANKAATKILSHAQKVEF